MTFFPFQYSGSCQKVWITQSSNTNNTSFIILTN